MRTICKVASVLAMALFVAVCQPAYCLQGRNTKTTTLRSPNGRIQLRITTGRVLQYSVLFDGQSVITDAGLGLEFKDAVPLGNTGEESVLRGELRKSVRSVWKPVWGKHSLVQDKYNEIRLDLREAVGARRLFEIVARAYDDGIAFRYALPKQSGLEAFTLTREHTEFRFQGDPTVWAADYGGFASSQEGTFQKRKMSTITPNATTALPLLIQAQDRVWAAITEADLQDWAGMYLGSTTEPVQAGSVALTTRLAPRPDGAGLVTSMAPRSSPWRVIMLSDRPGAFIESDLIANLSEPCAIADPSWVKPGKCAWDHWWSGDVKMDTPTQKEYIQFASDMGFPYQLIDWQWYGAFNSPNADVTKINPNIDMPELLRFARERNVRLFVWLYWKDIDRKLEEAFALYEKWGLAGVKIDFMDRDDQEMVNWYHKVIRKAAEHHLMVDFHGAYKPTGTYRTWPNQITREGVLGEEYAKFSKLLTPDHDVTLPFTRMLAGPMDYTPGGFLNRSKGKWKQTLPTEVMGTRGHELAKFVIFDSPLTVLCDHPRNYRGQAGLEFLRVVPTSWDETKVLEGMPGEYITMARRSGQAWYLGGMTNSESRTRTLKLDFLGKGSYVAHIYRDAPDADEIAEHLVEETKTVTAGTELELWSASGGGFAVQFIPVPAK